MNEYFIRTGLLIGRDGLEKLKNSKVVIFGVGGVGSYAAEALARSGVGCIALVDNDVIVESNINRQIHAMTSTIGQHKVEVMGKRIKDINPECKVEMHMEFYESGKEYLIKNNDYVIDAIDSMTSKIDLIIKCKKFNIPIISSMGAGNKMDPTQLTVIDIYKTSKCPMAKVIRRELRNAGVESLKVVYSSEDPFKPSYIECGFEEGSKRIPGSISFVPSAFGLTLAGEVIKDIIYEHKLT